MKEYKYAKPERQASKLTKRHLAGGPWHGQHCKLPDDGTMIFQIGDQRGSYNAQGRWCEPGAPARRVEVSSGRWVAQ